MLARRLVELCRKGYITNAEVQQIVSLWQNLPEVDKGPVDCPTGYKDSLTKGRFKKAKTYTAGSVAQSGLESMKL